MSDYQNFKASPMVTDLNNEGDLYAQKIEDIKKILQMWSKRPHQEDRSQISDCQNFKVSPLVTDLISENNEGDLYTPFCEDYTGHTSSKNALLL